MEKSEKRLRETPSQTAGPYVHIGLAPRITGIKIYDPDPGVTIAGPLAQGSRISITGSVTDGTGAPVKDALIEVWQADARGVYPGRIDVDADFQGWGRVVPNLESGVFTFDTIKPGPVGLENGGETAPHLNLWIVARGINIGLNTRIYFEDEPEANAQDPLLRSIDSESRRRTLIARGANDHYQFDIRLQGETETVFLDV